MYGIFRFFWVRFICSVALSCAFAWLAGFNFDHRNEWVATWAFMTLVFSIALAGG